MDVQDLDRVQKQGQDGRHSPGCDMRKKAEGTGRGSLGEEMPRRNSWLFSN